MRIDGLINRQYSNMGTKAEKTTAGTDASFMADAVSFGSSEDNIFGGSGEKSSFLSGADGSIETLKERASLLKDNLGAIFNKMDTGTAVRMDEDGIDINNTDSKEVLTVVERIQIKLAMYCDDFEAGADIDTDALEQVVGDGALAARVAGKLRDNGIKPTRENVSELMGAMEMASRVPAVDEGMKVYLMQNNMTPSIRNVYIADNAGCVNKSGVISEKEWHELLPQVRKIMDEAGVEPTKEALARGRWMLDNEIQVTKDSFDKLEALDNIQNILENKDVLIDRIAAAMTEGLAAKDAIITGESLPWEEAVTAVLTVAEAAEETVAAWVSSGRDYTLEGLADTALRGEKIIPDKNDYKYIKASRELQEIRLMMTVDSARAMERRGICVNTLNISELIEELKKQEAELLNLGKKDDEKDVTLMDVEQVNMAMAAIDSLRFAPAAVIGSVLDSGEEPTVNALSYHAPAVTARMEAAGNAYEALSTQIRSDLGDSVAKAVKASTGDILSNLGYDDNEAGRRAVRILAYNGMEINVSNIDRVKSVDYSVNELFRNMTPQRVLNMIREGVNPLDTNVEELNSYFINMYENIRPEVEKYSEFLYRMDKNGKISAAEREKFVGVYSLISKFQKDGMNAAGALVNQGLPLTMGNLLTAYMSRKDSKMDFKVDENTGLAAVRDRVTYYRHLLGGVSTKVTPDALLSVGDEFDSMTPEQFSARIWENGAPSDDEVYVKYAETAREAAQLDESVLKIVADNGVEATYNNIMAAQVLAENPGSIFSGYKDKTGDGELENRLLEALESKESALSEYDALMEQVRRLADEAVGKTDSYIDMEAMRLLGNNMKLIGALAHKNNYHIPYQTEEGTGVINLKVIETGENTGSFLIKMSSLRAGDITVEARADSRSLRAQIMCTSIEGVGILEEKSAQITAALEALGMEDVRINVNRAQSQPDGKAVTADGVSTKVLFKAAQIFIRNFTN